MIREEGIHIPFHFAAGTAGSRFLVVLRDEQRILGSRCPSCERVLCPVRAFCPDCGSNDMSEVEVGPEGALVSWTDVPGAGAFALVALDGADTGLLHKLIGEASGLRVGARMRVRFAADRTGNISDLEGFEPIQGGAA